MKIILAGPGAFGKKHLDGLKHIEGVEVVALVGQPLEPTQAVAAQYGIPHDDRSRSGVGPSGS